MMSEFQKNRKAKNPKIAVLAGVFDPVHNGHIAAVQKVLDKGLAEQAVLVAEKLPHNKPNATAYQHRQKMLELALENEPKISAPEAPISEFKIKPFFSWLQSKFLDAEFIWLMGSDTFSQLHKWPESQNLAEFGVSKIIVLSREINPQNPAENLKIKNIEILKIKSPQPKISSSILRENPKTLQQKTSPKAHRYTQDKSLYLKKK